MSNLKYTGYVLGVMGGIAFGFYLGIFALQSSSVKDYIIGYFEANSYSFLGIDMPLPILFFIGPTLIFLGLGILAIYRPPRNMERIQPVRTYSTSCRYCGHKLEPKTTFCPTCKKAQT